METGTTRITSARVRRTQSRPAKELDGGSLPRQGAPEERFKTGLARGRKRLAQIQGLGAALGGGDDPPLVATPRNSCSSAHLESGSACVAAGTAPAKPALETSGPGA